MANSELLILGPEIAFEILEDFDMLTEVSHKMPSNDGSGAETKLKAFVEINEVTFVNNNYTDDSGRTKMVIHRSPVRIKRGDIIIHGGVTEKVKRVRGIQKNEEGELYSYELRVG